MKEMKSTELTNIDDARMIVTIREVNASKENVFKAWSDPVHLAQWWGPKGFTNTFHEFDFVPGGRWKLTMHGPKAGHYENESIFREIVANHLVIWDRVSKPLFAVAVTFEQLETNRTKITFRMIFESEAECNKVKTVAVPSNEENFDRLEQELKKITTP
jgi:uncharacterized protein YndB with AHSA1/START domain